MSTCQQIEIRTLTSDKELYVLLDLLDFVYPYQLSLLSGACDHISIEHELVEFAKTVTGTEPSKEILDRATNGFGDSCNRVIAYYADEKLHIVRCVY